ncbi:hypothetical protein F5Y19DRAFT_166282 [Xylariaceae sp. FL1651]|nr:hypothetical protein F5Y19DRAFT_166282 [Xylariaceae sp. FL1651]
MPTIKSRPRPQPRRHSLSSGDETFYPHPTKPDGLPRRNSQRRARLPRSKSTSNIFDTPSCTQSITEYDVDNVAIERTDVDSLRELAEFLRTTGPPSGRFVAREDCLKLSGSGRHRRWSLQLPKKDWGLKLQRYYSHSHLPESAIPGTTADGRRYISITTPAPKNSNINGPWFRSQYPIFLPQPPTGSTISRREWPERISSKRTPFSDLGNITISGDAKGSPRPVAASYDKDFTSGPAGQKETLAGLYTIDTDHMLRAVPNKVDEGYEYGLKFSLGVSSPRRGSIVEPVRKPLGRQVPTLLVAVDKQEVDGPVNSQEAAASPTASATKPFPEEAHGQRCSPISAAFKCSPCSPGRSPRRPAALVSRPTLAVPAENLLPESPGFPNMLAAMTFPSPPRGSRPSSPAGSTQSLADDQAFSGIRPMIRPRTSSRRGCTSVSVSAASLDEIVMRKRPPLRHVKSEGSRQTSAALGQSTRFEASSRPSLVTRPATKSGLELPSQQEGTAIGQRRPAEYSAANWLAEGRSITSSHYGDEEFHRDSLASQITIPTNSFRQTTPTCSSPRPPSTSDIGIQCSFSIHPNVYGDETKVIHDDNLLALERYIVISTENRHSELYIGNRNLEETSFGASILSATDGETSTEPRSIHERRLARKAKVREYKLRDLDVSRVEPLDSPVLGYFSLNALRARKSSLQECSSLANGSSALSAATVSSRASHESQQSFKPNMPANGHSGLLSSHDQGQERGNKEDPLTLSSQLKISSIIATYIEPGYPPTSHRHTSGITMSPIMVVADVESRTGSLTLQLPTLVQLEAPSPRTMGRPKPLKLVSQMRQNAYPVTISRNPSTGIIERTATGSLDPKFKRRSLITLPTPPMSPEIAQSPKRLSLPPVQSSMYISGTPWDRTSVSRRYEWHASHGTEREPENKARSTTLKERVMREKLQKEKEIVDIVAKTISPQQREVMFDDEPSRLPQENLERRLGRLEKNIEAWVSAMNPLLETMTRTLDNMRENDRYGSLKKSEFITDMEAEARGFSWYGQRIRQEERDPTQRGFSNSVSAEKTTNSALRTSGVLSLAPVRQELDQSSARSKQATQKIGHSGSEADDTSLMPRNPVVSSLTPGKLETRPSGTIRHQIFQKEVRSEI